MENMQKMETILFPGKDSPYVVYDRTAVHSINGITPDENGDIAIELSETNLEDVALKSDVEVLQNSEANQQLVTDADGNVKWEDKTHYKKDRITLKLSPKYDKASTSSGRKWIGGTESSNPIQIAAAKTIAHELAYWLHQGLYEKWVFYWDGDRCEMQMQKWPILFEPAKRGVPFGLNVKQTGDEFVFEVMYNDDNEHTLEFELAEPELKQLDEDFIPDTIARKSDVERLTEEIADYGDGILPYAETRVIHVGENLFNADNLTLGAGWTYSDGVISHASGQTEAATLVFDGADGEDYLLEFTTNYSSGEFATYGIGNGYPNLAYNGTNNIVIPLRCWSEARLVMTPYALTGITHPAFTMSDIKLRKIQEAGDEVVLNYISAVTVQNAGNYGNRNVIFGHNSATKAVGSTRLVVLGNAALKDLQGGHRNIAIGGSSLQNMVGGNENIAIGADAAIYLTEGENNFAMGVGALARGKKLTDNIAIGKQALEGDADSAAYNNIAIGNEAGLHANANARMNVFIGRRAGYQNYASYGNTNIGAEAGTGTFTAWNTMIGCRANAEGGAGNCTVIGANASITGENRAHSIVIGANAQATKSRQCVIGSTEVNEVIFCGNKKIIFNDDGTVTWETI